MVYIRLNVCVPFSGDEGKLAAYNFTLKVRLRTFPISGIVSSIRIL